MSRLRTGNRRRLRGLAGLQLANALQDACRAASTLSRRRSVAQLRRAMRAIRRTGMVDVKLSISWTDANGQRRAIHGR